MVPKRATLLPRLPEICLPEMAKEKLARRRRGMCVVAHFCRASGTLLFFTSCTLSDPTPPAPAKVPFLVSDYFAATGFMGDPDGLSISIQERCKKRPDGAGGLCYRIEYTPTENGEGWAGIYWQAPMGNWGDEPGRIIEGTPREISFSAASGDGEQIVSFFAGGLGSAYSAGEDFTHTDSFLEKVGAVVTENYQEQVISLDDVDVNAEGDGVLGGFGFSITAPPTGETIVLFLDDVRWK
jgi:hypothetical protein